MIKIILIAMSVVTAPLAADGFGIGVHKFTCPQQASAE